MVELSTFVGQIVSDIASARTNADYYAAGISEQYHADPFVKSLPIPHYIIEDVEVEVPVMVVGITKSSDEYAVQKEKLFEAIKQKLPLYVLRSYKYNFIKSREESGAKEAEKNKSREKLRLESSADVKNSGSTDERDDNSLKMAAIEFKPEQLDEFNESAKKITENMVANVGNYLDTYNYELVKILDLADDFREKLRREIKRDVASYTKSARPYLSDESITDSAKYIGNLMFFEFKKIMRSSASVQVDINTVKMNEYATQDCLMHIKLKIKEQDLTLQVEEDEKGKEKRYLSLT